MKPKIVVTAFPDLNSGFFATSIMISKSEESFNRPLSEKSKPYLTKVGKPGASVVREIIKIPGVTRVGISSYGLNISISRAHNWLPIEKRIIKIISNLVFPKREPEVVHDNILD